MIMATEKSNVKEWLELTATASKGSHYAALYKRIHRMLQTPSREMAAVSTFKLNSSTREGDNVIVPRKVLASGRIDHKFNIAALEYSSGALKELRGSGCNVVEIKEMIGKTKISVIV
jgi:large subunit ribosomal protein L18e